MYDFTAMKAQYGSSHAAFAARKAWKPSSSAPPAASHAAHSARSSSSDASRSAMFPAKAEGPEYGEPNASTGFTGRICQ